MSEGSKERSSASFINLLRYFEKASTPLLIEYCGGSGHSTPAASDPAGSLTGSRRNVMFPCSIESAV
ncbi:hypothetical protein PC123_g17872 [Phytophthora cactorum]|nr:hypothetical protein PC123_g17872 [Phytophthora cactorum]